MLSNDIADQAVLPGYETNHVTRENLLGGGISILYKQNTDVEAGLAQKKKTQKKTHCKKKHHKMFFFNKSIFWSTKRLGIATGYIHDF